MINRAVLMVRYQDPSLNWINGLELYTDSKIITRDDTNNDSTVYLISVEDSESKDSLNAWLELNYKQLFESELASWCDDQNYWPQQRTLELFNQWFSIECHTIIIDTVDKPISDDDF